MEFFFRLQEREDARRETLKISVLLERREEDFQALQRETSKQIDRLVQQLHDAQASRLEAEETAQSAMDKLRIANETHIRNTSEMDRVVSDLKSAQISMRTALQRAAAAESEVRMHSMKRVKGLQEDS